MILRTELLGVRKEKVRGFRMGIDLSDGHITCIRLGIRFSKESLEQV